MVTNLNQVQLSISLSSSLPFCISTVSFLYRTGASAKQLEREEEYIPHAQDCVSALYVLIFLLSDSIIIISKGRQKQIMLWLDFISSKDSGAKMSIFFFPMKISNFNNVLVLDYRAQNPMGTNGPGPLWVVGM